jgi:glutathione S-transferase
MFAALNTIEPTINERLENPVRYRLSELSARLGTDEWLEGSFSAGDLLMAMVLRPLRDTNVLHEHENLVAYVARGEARPAFKKALMARAD